MKHLTLSKVAEFSKQKHHGQYDKGGEEYYHHPNRVADKIWQFFDGCEVEDIKYRTNILDIMKVAFLHDVLEDTDTTVEDLRMLGLPEELIDGVLSVTRKDGESYSEFVKRASENEYGLLVKYFDIEDNLDIRRLPQVTDGDISRLNKYLKWYRYLETIIKEKYDIEEEEYV